MYQRSFCQVQLLFADDKCQWIADVQCNVQTEAESVQSCTYCYHSVQKNDGLVCCLLLIFDITDVNPFCHIENI